MQRGKKQIVVIITASYDGGDHTIRSATAENPLPHANFTVRMYNEDDDFF